MSIWGLQKWLQMSPEMKDAERTKATCKIRPSEEWHWSEFNGHEIHDSPALSKWIFYKCAACESYTPHQQLWTLQNNYLASSPLSPDGNNGSLRNKSTGDDSWDSQTWQVHLSVFLPTFLPTEFSPLTPEWVLERRKTFWVCMLPSTLSVSNICTMMIPSSHFSVFRVLI